MDITTPADFACAAKGDDAELLHERLGHFSMARINSALGTNMMSNFSKIDHVLKSCEACMLNKQKKAVPKAGVGGTVYLYFGQRISSDTAGPFPESPGGFKYAICFYDHCTKWVAIYFLRTHYTATRC